jgi:hypothetical protein
MKEIIAMSLVGRIPMTLGKMTTLMQKFLEIC